MAGPSGAPDARARGTARPASAGAAGKQTPTSRAVAAINSQRHQPARNRPTSAKAPFVPDPVKGLLGPSIPSIPRREDAATTKTPGFDPLGVTGKSVAWRTPVYSGGPAYEARLPAATKTSEPRARATAQRYYSPPRSKSPKA